MHLNRSTDFALRVLLVLAVEPERVVSATEISQGFGISTHHVRSVAKTLVQQGWVVGQRGQGGGLRLAVSPDQLRVGQVVRALEDLDLLECFQRETDQCVISPACKLKAALREALLEFARALDRYTLADLVAGRAGRLRKLLTVAPARADPRGGASVG